MDRAIEIIQRKADDTALQIAHIMGKQIAKGGALQVRAAGNGPKVLVGP